MTPPTARTYGWLALGSLAFILYGSLVPFEFRARPAERIFEAFTGAMTQRVKIQSLSDAFANFLLGVPLGFALLGWTCVDRGSPAREIRLGLLFLPTCILFSTFVEFLQLYCPKRTCAASDVLMQAVGVVAGMLGWIFAGQWLTGHARRLWAGPGIGGSAGRILVVYIALLAILQALPLDLTLSPKDVYKNLRDKVRYIPFRELVKPQPWEEYWGHARARIETLGLYLPLGLLAGCLPGRFWRSPENGGRIFGLALLLAAGMEAIQIFVMSQTPNSSDWLIGAGSVVLGWWLARQALSRTTRAILTAAWVVLLIVVYWEPFVVSSNLSRVEWLVLMPLEARNPLTALGDLLTKLVLFGLLGVMVIAETRDFPTRMRLYAAIALGLTVSFVIELGQLMMPSHTPSATDVVLGGVGAWFGAAAALRACPQSAVIVPPQSVVCTKL